MNSIRWFAAACAVALSLTGCATFSPDGGFGDVEQLTQERTGQSPRWQRSPVEADAVRNRVTELLKAPLAADAAVEIALMNNPGLQARFFELGIAESELVEAGRLRNPVFSFGRLGANGVYEIERAVMVNVLAILTMPLATDFQQRRFGQTQLQVAGEAVAVAAEARRSYFSAVASRELVTYFEQVKAAAEVSSELARRMVQAGNFSKLAQMREQAFHADATAQLARARHRVAADRERLIRALGLSGGSTSFPLPDRLPDLPKTPVDTQDAERTAMEKRLDVMAAKRSAEALARSMDLTRITRVINVLEVGYQNKNASGEPRENGYEIEVELPVFDFGTTRIARAEASYMQAVQRTAEVAINARSEVREAYSAYRTSFDLARHYRDEVVPLRKRITEENVLRYNGMLIGVFELLADAREQVDTVASAIGATRDFWLAETDLQIALTGSSPAGGGAVRAPSASPVAAGAEH